MATPQSKKIPHGVTAVSFGFDYGNCTSKTAVSWKPGEVHSGLNFSTTIPYNDGVGRPDLSDKGFVEQTLASHRVTYGNTAAMITGAIYEKYATDITGKHLEALLLGTLLEQLPPDMTNIWLYIVTGIPFGSEGVGPRFKEYFEGKTFKAQLKNRDPVNILVKYAAYDYQPIWGITGLAMQYTDKGFLEVDDSVLDHQYAVCDAGSRIQHFCEILKGISLGNHDFEEGGVWRLMGALREKLTTVSPDTYSPFDIFAALQKGTIRIGGKPQPIYPIIEAEISQYLTSFRGLINRTSGSWNKFDFLYTRGGWARFLAPFLQEEYKEKLDPSQFLIPDDPVRDMAYAMERVARYQIFKDLGAVHG